VTGPSKALANGDRKHPEGEDMEVDGDNEADADDEGEDGHGSPEESGDDSEGPEEGEALTSGLGPLYMLCSVSAVESKRECASRV
jgi:hypothetical protein